MVVDREPDVTAIAVIAPESDAPAKAATTAGFLRERTNEPIPLSTFLLSVGAARSK